MEEVAHPRIVAVAQDGLAAKVRLVVRKFAFDVLEAGVELVLLLLLRPSEAAVVVLRHLVFPCGYIIPQIPAHMRGFVSGGMGFVPSEAATKRGPPNATHPPWAT